jgi:hypothetical protein
MAATRKSTLIPLEADVKILANASGRHEGEIQRLATEVKTLDRAWMYCCCGGRR